MRRVSILCAAALAGILAGCGSGTRSTSPGAGAMTQQTADDVAIQSLISVNVIGGDLGAAVGGTPMASAASARPARVLSLSRALWDTTFVSEGITYQASRTFYDLAGNALPDWSPLAVRVRWTSWAYGLHQSDRDTTTIGHSALLDVRGIQAAQDTLQLDGHCADTLQTAFRSYDGTRTHYFYWRSAMAVTAVRILKSQLQGGGSPVPLSGTLRFTVSADRLRSNSRVDVEAHFDAVVEIVFDGTTQPEVTVDGTYHYHWMLATGQIVRA